MAKSKEEVIGAVLRALEKSRAQKAKRAQSIGGASGAAAILNALAPAARRKLMDGLMAQIPDLARQIKRHTRSAIEDLLELEDLPLQRLLAQVAHVDLALALMGASRSLQRRCLGQVSRRTAELVVEEMRLRAPGAPELIEAARSRIIARLERRT